MVIKETIWHFVCPSCKGWWSMESFDEWKPKALYCPHCGDKNTFEYHPNCGTDDCCGECDTATIGYK